MSLQSLFSLLGWALFQSTAPQCDLVLLELAHLPLGDHDSGWEHVQGGDHAGAGPVRALPLTAQGGCSLCTSDSLFCLALLDVLSQRACQADPRWLWQGNKEALL